MLSIVLYEIIKFITSSLFLSLSLSFWFNYILRKKLVFGMARPDHVCPLLSKRWRQARAVPLRSAREQCAMLVFEPAPTVATRFVISKERKKGRKKLGVKNPMHRLWRRVTTRGIVRGGWTRNGRRSMEFVSSTCCRHTMKYRSEDIESEMLLKHVVASCYVPMQTIPVFLITYSVILWKLG